MANATFGNHVGSGQCCLFERLRDMYDQQWDKQPKRGTAECTAPGMWWHPQLAPLAVLLTTHLWCLFPAHFPETLMGPSAFEQWNGCPLSLSTSGCPGWIDMERSWSVPGSVLLALFAVTDCTSVLILQPI